MERPSEICRVLLQNEISLRYCASAWFYYRNILGCTVIQTSNTKILSGYRDLNARYFQQETGVLSSLTTKNIETYILRRKVELSVIVLVEQVSDFIDVFLLIPHYLELLS